MTQTAQLYGPCAKDIFPIFGKNQNHLYDARSAIEEAVKRSGGVRVYRIPEGSEHPIKIDNMTNGDLMIMGIDQDLPQSESFQKVAEILGTPRDVLNSFRFVSKSHYKKRDKDYPIPPFVTDLNDVDPAKLHNGRDLEEGGDTANFRLYSTDIEKVKTEIEHLITGKLENRPERSADVAFVATSIFKHYKSTTSDIDYDGPIFEQGWTVDDVVRIALKDYEGLSDYGLDFEGTPDLREDCCDILLDVIGMLQHLQDDPDAAFETSETVVNEMLEQIYQIAAMIHHHCTATVYSRLGELVHGVTGVSPKLSDMCEEHREKLCKAYYKRFEEFRVEVADSLIGDYVTAGVPEDLELSEEDELEIKGSDDSDDRDNGEILLEGATLDIEGLEFPVTALIGNLHLCPTEEGKFSSKTPALQGVISREVLSMVLRDNPNRNAFDAGGSEFSLYYDGTKEKFACTVSGSGINFFSKLESAIIWGAGHFFNQASSSRIEDLAATVAETQAEMEATLSEVEEIRKGSSESRTNTYDPWINEEFREDGMPPVFLMKLPGSDELVEMAPVWPMESTHPHNYAGLVQRTSEESGQAPLFNMRGEEQGMVDLALVTFVPPKAVQYYLKGVPVNVTVSELFKRREILRENINYMVNNPIQLSDETKKNTRFMFQQITVLMGGGLMEGYSKT